MTQIDVYNARPALGTTMIRTTLVRAVLGYCVLVSTTSLAAEPAKLEIIAHRGASADAPENTLAAVKLSFEQQADTCEIDVWISKDGKPVVIHDSDTKRVAGVAKKVSEQTLAELRQLDVGRWKDARFEGTRIPTLEEALAAIPAGKRVFVEIKCGPDGVPAIVKAVQQSALKPEQPLYIGFSAAVLARVKQEHPEAMTLWIVSLKEEKEKPPVPLADLIAKARELKAEGLNVSASPRIDADFLKQVREAGLKLYVWTVDDPKIARPLQALGVDGITTNRPVLLRKQLQEDAPPK